MFLLERLESQIATGTGVPRTRKVLVDKDAILDLIDQLRVAVPEEIHAAKRINAEGERIVEKANEESSRILARAQEQATYLIGEKGLLEAAQNEGRQIIADAIGGRRRDPRRCRRVRRPDPRDARGRGAQGARRHREGHRRARGTPGRSSSRSRSTSADGEEKPLDDWPAAGDDAPAYALEEDPGQTVPR